MIKDWNWLKKRASIHPHKIAIITGERKEEWSYQALYVASLKWAKLLHQMGLRQGDRACLLAPNRVEYIILLFACRELGAIFVPLNWRLSPYELQGLLEDCRPSLLIYDEGFLDLVESLQWDPIASLTEIHAQVSTINLQETSLNLQEDPVDLGQAWMMIYTGGTTGKPKGAVLSYRSVTTNAINTIITWSLTESERTMTVMPMFHTGGINALTIPILHVGGTVILSESFNPASMIGELLYHKCTTVLMVPTMYQSMIEREEFQQESFPHMKVFLSGGAPCPVNIYDAFKKRGLPFKEGYGLTEAGPNNFYIDPEVAAKKRGSVGKPMLFNDVKIMDDAGNELAQGEIGEMVIYGGHLFDHYWQREEETRKAVQDGGLRTGDLAYQDLDGDFYILGRKKEMLISGGENVYPLEVENVMAAHPDVQEVAVLGLADSKWGERVVAAVRHKEMREEKNLEEELKIFCGEKLASYKIPKDIYFFEQLPKTHVGKMDKKAIRDKIQQRKRVYK